MLMSRPCKHAPLHEQVAFLKWKQPIYDNFVSPREFSNLKRNKVGEVLDESTKMFLQAEYSLHHRKEIKRISK